MKNLIRIIASALVFAIGPAFATGPLTEAHKKQIETIIQDYILDNPEIITKAITALQARQREAEERGTKAALVANRSRLSNDPTSPVGGNPNGDVTLIEFFDYRCGVCKRVHPIVAKLVDDDRKIRRVYKEWPILGPASLVAARAALASRKQGKYIVFHNAMMEARGRLDQAAVMRIAKRVGLDTTQLARDMDGPGISRVLQRNFALAEALKLTGTPSFVIGDTLLRGGRDLATMRKLVAEARAGK